MSSFKVAFYKGNNNWWDKYIRWWDRGPYSHCEIVFSDGMWGTSFMKGGMLLRPRNVNPADWDFIELPSHLEPAARKWFEARKGRSYDYVGLLRFVFDFLGPSRDKWICSRACADALGMKDGWRVTPNGLASELRNALTL